MTQPMTGTTGASGEIPIVESRQTNCCVVGGGPGGMMLALLLARAGVPVTLLEAHKDFDRDFRGDTIHPAILEILDEIGLAAPLHQLQHAKIYGPTFRSGDSSFNPFDFRRLKTAFPYVMLIPQARFLDFLAAEAARYPAFRLVMGARVEELIEEEGMIRGIRYTAEDGRHEVRAALTVGADGRFSKVRQLAGFEPVKASPPIDILWFRLPHIPGDLPEASGRVLGGFSQGRMLAVFDRFDYWQVGFVFPKGQYAGLRAAGLEALKQRIAEIEPRFTEHLRPLTDWTQFSLLSVEASRCRRWYKPGLLLIGDAAHVMSPVGGQGINYAVQDAVVAANFLSDPLKAGHLTVGDLARVQRRREWPTRIIQAIQSFAQQQLVGKVRPSQAQPTAPRQIPWFVRMLFRIPVLGNLPGRMLAFGVGRAHVKQSLRERPSPAA